MAVSSTILWHRLRQGKKLLIVLFGFIIFLLLLHFILQWESTNERMFAKLDIDLPINFVPVRTTEREPLPSSGELKIPTRIHQTWKSSHIPPDFAPWVQTWPRHHPDWEYWFWTDETARQLIASKYPKLLETFDNYALPLRRADALRYVVLYEYGGVYADIDMEALTPLDSLARKYPCFFGQEPYEHPILDSNFQTLVINALMGCEKGHPFIKSLIDNLPAYSTMWHVLDSTGPHYVTKLFKEYMATPQYKTKSVYITPPEYFYPKMDPVKIGYFFKKCNDFQKLSKLQKNACRNLKFKNLYGNIFDAKKVAFTEHHWSHTSLNYFASETDIRDLVPNMYHYRG